MTNLNHSNKRVFILFLLQVIDGFLIAVASLQAHQKAPKTHCSRPSEWIIQEENVCYGMGMTRLGKPPLGYFTIKGNHTLVAIRLVHQSGALTCALIPEARWGCRSISPCNSDCFTTLVGTPDGKYINFNNRNEYNMYTYPGFSVDDDVLVIKSPDWPIPVKDGDRFSIISNGGTGESGVHCVNVDASFLL